MKHCEWCGRAYDYRTYGSTINYCSEKCKREAEAAKKASLNASFSSSGSPDSSVGCLFAPIKLVLALLKVAVAIIALPFKLIIGIVKLFTGKS